MARTASREETGWSGGGAARGCLLRKDPKGWTVQCIGPVRGLPSRGGTEIGFAGTCLDGAITTWGLGVWFESIGTVRHFPRVSVRMGGGEGELS